MASIMKYNLFIDTGINKILGDEHDISFWYDGWCGEYSQKSSLSYLGICLKICRG
jgi:hypothetical protein